MTWQCHTLIQDIRVYSHVAFASGHASGYNFQVHQRSVRILSTWSYNNNTRWLHQQLQPQQAHQVSVPHPWTSNASAEQAELDAAVLEYLASRGLTKSAKAFEKEVPNAKAGSENGLVKAWTAFSQA